MPLNMINGWTLIALMACLAAFGNWCFRPRNSISGGGGIGSDISSLSDVYELVPTPVIDSIQWLCAVFYNMGRLLLAVATGFGKSSPDNYELVIAVISRLTNIEKRNVIRKTWKSLSLGVSGSSSIRSKVYFVMPEQLCSLDPNWRLHDAGCDPWQVDVPANANENTFYNPMRIAKSMVRPGLAYDGLGFKIKFPVTIRNLGIAKRGLIPYSLKGTNLSVELLDATRPNEALVSVNFTKTDLDEDQSDDGYIYKTVLQEMSLSKGFEGYLRIKVLPSTTENISSLKLEDLVRDTTQYSARGITCNIVWNKQFGDDGVIIWTSLLKDSSPVPFSFNSCPLVSFIYQVPDIAELRQISSQKITQNKCQENKNKNIAAKLVEEYEDFDDDVFVATDLIDTNDSLSGALLTFIQWLSDGTEDPINEPSKSIPEQGNTYKNFLHSMMSHIINRYSRHNPINFNYLLITNDESFIAIDQVLPRLALGSPAYFRTKEFRSRFQYLEPVQYHGVAAETTYVSKTYPPIPAHAGSLLSKDLVRFLSITSKSGLLKSFSSVEKSLSIWLAAAGPTYIDDSGWNVDTQTCSIHSMAAGPYIEQNSMIQAWDNYLLCGKMCSCT